MSEIKVNKISPRSGTTVTLGDSGDTFTIPSGATISNAGTAAGFGATGEVSWSTTVKTGDFTATSGEGYFVNTTSGEIDVTLPAGSAGSVVAVADYADTADTNNIILKQNGSDKIEGSTDDFIVNIEGVSIALVYVDSTKGWIVTNTGNSTAAFEVKYVTASGGTVTCSGNFKIHTFTGPGTFTVTCAGNSGGSNTVDYQVVAGAGGAGSLGGGGAGGGYRESCGTCYTSSPLGSGVAGLPVTAQGYPIVIGAGGAGGPAINPGSVGSNSSFSTITSAGGGFGGGHSAGAVGDGGSGGGGGFPSPATHFGAGNTPPVSPAQGFPGGGGQAANTYSGGGGGATEAGETSPGSGGGRGGAGATSNITASPVSKSGGGGGAINGSSPGSAGAGSPCGTGKAGVKGATGSPGPAGAANTGGGGGGGSHTQSPPVPSDPGGAGGSGIVVIRYKYQN
jgi:hypothetical protein